MEITIQKCRVDGAKAFTDLIVKSDQGGSVSLTYSFRWVGDCWDCIGIAQTYGYQEFELTSEEYYEAKRTAETGFVGFPGPCEDDEDD